MEGPCSAAVRPAQTAQCPAVELTGRRCPRTAAEWTNRSTHSLQVAHALVPERHYCAAAHTTTVGLLCMRTCEIAAEIRHDQITVPLLMRPVLFELPTVLVVIFFLFLSLPPCRLPACLVRLLAVRPRVGCSTCLFFPLGSLLLIFPSRNLLILSPHERLRKIFPFPFSRINLKSCWWTSLSLSLLSETISGR